MTPTVSSRPGAPQSTPRQNVLWRLAALTTAALIAACATPVPPPPAAPPPPPPPMPAEAPPPLPPAPVTQLPDPDIISTAVTPRDYRQDGARHIYQRNGHRIFKGRLPPLMHAVGVLQVDVDGRGNVQAVNWMREIERTVREAAPFPAPVRMGRVTYTDVWLWDRSGHFQLDTLTEGQRDR